MYRLRVLNIPSRNVAEIVSDLPQTDRVITLLQNWDGETFAFTNHRDARHYRRVLNDILRRASYQEGTPLPPSHWNAEWDTFEIVVEVYKPDNGWRIFDHE